MAGDHICPRRYYGRPAAARTPAGTMDDRSQPSGCAGARTVAVYSCGCTHWRPGGRHSRGRVVISTLGFPQFWASPENYKQKKKHTGPFWARDRKGKHMPD
ncbi:hypothetical protein L484_011442 [Morus notabilis]|uniref:Uncharacterized protein n=1 Tax=Morus notabilis TaxID=981085 RepID=W9QKR6_9ROSA|nr:hypothetical protein L484_011442 [Morus notabilis]